MKNILDAPSWQAGPVRLADFAELLALAAADGNVAAQDLIENLGRIHDEDENRFERPVFEAFEELADRPRLLGTAANLYPFTVDQDELAVRPTQTTDGSEFLYLFLLLTTRLNMKSDRIHAGLDAAEIFEHLCLEVAKNYFGGRTGRNVEGHVFGTSRAAWMDRTDDDDVNPNTFENAVNALCKELGEGEYFRAKDTNVVKAKDDKLDIVVWRNFSDERSGKLIAFGQCKTGSSWELELPRLNPLTFTKRWFHTLPTVIPVKMFFLAERVRAHWNSHCEEAGILFDRCRVVDYADDLSPELLTKVCDWTSAALSDKKLCGP